jgi:opacity protein-like surface antigen
MALSTVAVPGFAQVEQHSQINIQATGLFTRDTNGQVPSNSVTQTTGLLAGYSYQFTDWIGVEGNYGYTRNDERFGGFAGTTGVQTDFHEVTGALIVRFPLATHVRPYVLGGGGALVFNPTQQNALVGLDQQTRGAFVYGGGVDFDITNHFGIRAEYRGLVYKVPDFTLDTLTLDRYTHLAQPSAGIFFRF